MKHLNVPMEIKARDTGAFSGYASIFGNVDLGYDVVEKGAFKEIVKNADDKVVVLWQHRQGEPLGVADVDQDEKGLAFDGQLVLEDPQSRIALAHMKAGSVRGMSIGFDILPGGAEYTEGGVRLIKEAKLWEISVVTFGMNPAAQIEAAKSIKSIREFEDFLRDEGGYSNAQAKLIACGGYKALQKARDESDGGAAVDQLVQSILAVPVPNF